MSHERRTALCMAAAGLVLALLIAPGRVAGEPHPSSDVLVPYFEVALDPTQSLNTLFSLVNNSKKPVEVTITVHTNWGIPVLRFPHTVTPDEVHSANLHDWLVEGKLFDRTLTAEELAHLQAALSGKPSPRDGLWYGTEVVPGRAVGYVTIRTNGDPRPDVLWGDYFLADPSADCFQGETLVNIDFTECDAPCKRHVIRFLEGGPFTDGTELIIWTDKRWNPSPEPEPLFEEGVKVRGLTYDEPGRFMGRYDLQLRPVQVLKVGALKLSEPFGWFDLTTEGPSFIGARYTESAQHTSSALHSYCVAAAATGIEGPAIQIRKKVNGEDADQPGLSIPIGTALLWEYEVSNLGSVPLSDVVVEDDTGIVVTCPQDTLEAGDSMTCTASGTAVPCEHVNTGSVVGWAPDQTPVRAEDLAYYTGSFRAEIRLDKAVNGEDADVPPGPSFQEGAALSWTFTVTNAGEVPLTGVAVSDPGLTVTCPKATLSPDETMTCTAGGTAQPGTHHNVATVQGKPPCGPNASASDPVYYTVIANEPAIDIQKLTNGEDADAEPGPSLELGAPVTWSYVVTNTGNMALSGVVVTDDRGVQVTCPKTALEPGESMTCTGRGVAQACQYTNLGTARAVVAAAPDRVVTDQDLSHYFGQINPRIAIEKKTEGQDADTPPGPDLLVGGKVHWTYLVTNFGDVPLTGLVVGDDYDVVVTCPKTSLAPGESMICTGGGLAVAGQYRNLGTATGTPPCGAAVSATDPSHYYGRTPDIALEKLVNGQEADVPPYPILRVGDPILWTFVATNTGDVGLANVTVTDSQGVTVSCPKTTLSAGESMTCVGTGTAVAGTHTNTGTVTGQALGTTVTASDPATYVAQWPAITLEKKVNGQEADTPPGPTVLVGSTVTWTFVVTNAGDVQLSGVALIDQGTAVACPKSVLAPGETMTCTATGTAIHGPYQNTATVSGTPPMGTPVTASDPAHYLGVIPGISLEKLVNGQDADTPPGPLVLVCSTLQWSYVVTNTGEVALQSVAVVDDQAQAARRIGSVIEPCCTNPIPFLTVTCPKTTLAVGESMTCTATSTAEEAGLHLNTATARGTPVPGGAQVTDQDSAYYTAVNSFQGCTPGYWKNHASSWPPTGYATGQTVLSVFGASIRFPGLAASTLVQALGFGGGSGDQGAAEILLRSGVAALLNAAHPEVAYPRSPESVLADVNATLAGTRDQMLSLAATLDADNNRGCPLR
ncbi:MAG TPA: hypothetical protein DD490_04470 [Acidobacteria bacterium]|nr:hypothetical protein [Acidobacteriota bacterium]